MDTPPVRESSVAIVIPKPDVAGKRSQERTRRIIEQFQNGEPVMPSEILSMSTRETVTWWLTHSVPYWSLVAAWAWKAGEAGVYKHAIVTANQHTDRATNMLKADLWENL